MNDCSWRRSADSSIHDSFQLAKPRIRFTFCVLRFTFLVLWVPSTITSQTQNVKRKTLNVKRIFPLVSRCSGKLVCAR